MKTKGELSALKEEAEALNNKLAELTEEELAQVSGGEIHISFVVDSKPVEGVGFASADKLSTGVKVNSGKD